MNGPLPPDAAEAMEWHEQRRAWRESAKADWARAQGSPIVSVWKPVQTDEQRKQHEIDVIVFNLPF